MSEQERLDWDNGLVPERWACPTCGERDMDHLIPGDDDCEIVTCMVCRTVYDLFA
jgi:hypothetical protein